MQIEVQAIHKQFKVPIRKAGSTAAIKQLFHRQYEVVHAVNDVNFSIDSGELIGYLGPNGAGKSTTLKMLTGILVPDSGSILVNNQVPWKRRQQHAAQIGVVFGQKSQLWWDLPLGDSFRLLKAIYKVPDNVYHAQWQWLVEGLGIGEYIQRPVRLLSLGQRMRAELVASLLHAPQILFLDEPTIGLDAPSKQTVRTFIQELNQKHGTTVILTTHDMDDIEALCSRVLVIDKGTLAFDGSLPRLREKVHNKRRLTLELGNDGLKVPIEQFDQIPLLNAATIMSYDKKNHKLLLEYSPEEVTTQGLITELAMVADIKDLLIENPPIEEIIARLYGEWA